MKKYQWYNDKLRQKAQTYDWLMLASAGVALVSRLMWKDVSGWLLLLLLVTAFVFFSLSWRVKSQDTRLKNKGKNKKSEEVKQ